MNSRTKLVARTVGRARHVESGGQLGQHRDMVS